MRGVIDGSEFTLVYLPSIMSDTFPWNFTSNGTMFHTPVSC